LPKKYTCDYYFLGGLLCFHQKNTENKIQKNSNARETILKKINQMARKKIGSEKKLKIKN
jgi:hypothetical protein